jgi:uncharacterized protein DUF6317
MGRMPPSDGFQVVLDDLQRASQTFHTEEGTFTGIMQDKVPVPDGGSAGFDHIAQAVVDAICALHLLIAKDIGDHSTKLQMAHDNYQRNEESLATLASQLMSSGLHG